MITGYRSNAPTEDGYYLVRVHSPSQTWDTIAQKWVPGPDVGELVIAEAVVGDSDITWIQVGMDYDYWTHESIARYELDVICRLDLEAIEQAHRRHAW